MENLIFLTCFILFAFLTAVSMLVMGYIFEYKSPDRIKSSTYECGIKVKHFKNISFNIGYFRYLIMFMIFDISSIFIYPILATGIEYSKSHTKTITAYLLLILFAVLQFTLHRRQK